MAPDPPPFHAAGPGQCIKLSPQIMIHSPPSQGTPGFRIGVSNALGGARARLVLVDAASGFPAGSFTSGSVTFFGALSRVYNQLLSGSGAGGGYGTRPTNVPNAAAILGLTVRAQWFVFDPGAAGGIARSDIAEFTIF